MEKVQSRVQEAIDKMITTLDSDHLRKMQAAAYSCSARCCQQGELSMEQVQRCVERCSDPRNQCQKYLETEMSTFQNRLQRCALDCQDRARDGLSANSKADDMDRLRAQMETCVVACADTHIALVPTMMRRAKEVMETHVVQ